jgi:hypothetical protein
MNRTDVVLQTRTVYVLPTPFHSSFRIMGRSVTKFSTVSVVTTAGGSGLSAEQDALLSNIDNNTTGIPAAV